MEEAVDVILAIIKAEHHAVNHRQVKRLIFQAFERARAGVRNAESIGVGLPVARTLAQLMGGDLQYRRESGMTVFELSLPLVTPAERAASPQPVAEGAAPVGPAR
jgi:K+-sensing histidine kinase KdpD